MSTDRKTTAGQDGQILDSETLPSSSSELRILNVIIATPKDRAGSVRAGLSLGKALEPHVDVDTVKMRGNHDAELFAEFDLNETRPIPSRTVLRDLGDRLFDTTENYANTLIWTRLTPPRPLDKYDIVHLHGAVPLAGMIVVALESVRAGIPYCVTTHGISKIPEIPENMEMGPVRRLVFEYCFLKPYLSVIRSSAHRFALSEHDRALLEKRFPGRPTSVTPNGVNPNPPSPDAVATVAAETGISPSRPLVLFVGKLLASKGLDDLLGAYDHLAADCTLAVVGPPEDPTYVDRFDACEGDVRYLGYTEQNLLSTLYQRADVFAFPTRSDVFPLVVLEAMAAATPVVTTTVGGIPEQVVDGSGILVPPRDPGRVADAIDRLLDDDDLRATMGRRALAVVRERFAWDAVARRTARIYRAVVERA